MTRLILAALLGVGCRAHEPGSLDTAEPGVDSPLDPVPGALDILYDADVVNEVSIVIDAEDWDTLRQQHWNLPEMFTGDCMSSPWESPYTWFPGSVTVNGETAALAGLRKKGSMGSASTTKPGLKVAFDEYEEGGSLLGVDGLTLNNAVQDSSLIRQCLGYELWRATGAPASRCNFAHVTVNGEDLGVYVNVEPLDKNFLREHFGDPEGDLYEGAGSDFREGFTGTFDRKTNEDDPDPGDIEALARALEVDDADLVAALDPLIDLDAFMAYWAMEVLLGHWDSYDGNINNFFVYHDPESGRFSFIPSGIDAVLEGVDPFGEGAPTSVVAESALSVRLYALPETRAAYQSALRDLLDTVWDEAAIAAEVDRMEVLLKPYVARSDRGTFEDGVDSVRTVAASRRDAILSELDAGGPDWEGNLRDAYCLTAVGTVAATFSLTWPDGDLYDVDGTTFSFTYRGDDIEITGASGAVADAGDETNVILAAYGQTGWGSEVLVYMLVPYDAFATGDLPVDWWTVTAYLYTRDTAADDWEVAAYVYDGVLQLDVAETFTGGAVVGSFDAGVWG